MRVTELITLTNRLSTDHSYLDDEEKAVYLSYLNMANLELYAIAATGLKRLTERKKIFLNTATQAFELPANLYNIRAVLVSGESLTMSNVDTELTVLGNKYLVEKNNLYCDLTGRSISVPLAADPDDNNTMKKYITLVYCTNPLKLVENVVDANTETDTPIYPEPYHYFLVHGALYYFYLSNRVLAEKISEIKERWEKDKKALAEFKNYGL